MNRASDRSFADGQPNDALPGSALVHTARGARACCLLATLGVLAACGGGDPGDGQADAPYLYARADLGPVSGSGMTGVVRFDQEAERLEIEGTIEGLPPGRYHLHVHEMEECSALDTGSAGAVFSPGEDAPDLALEPDLPNQAGRLAEIVTDAAGTATFEFVETRASIAPGDRSILDHALVVHDSPDGVGVPGKPVGCGPIRRTATRRYVP